MTGAIVNALPDIPRLYTAISEWLGCLVYICALYRRVPLIRTILTTTLGLPVLIGLQYFAGTMSLPFWIFGMCLAAIGMFGIIMLAIGTGKREGLYITARAFILGELIASLHWQLATFAEHALGSPPTWWENIILLVVTYGLCFVITYNVERGNFSQTQPTVPTLSAAVMTVATTLITFAMSNLSFVSTNTPFSGTIGQEVFYIRTLVDLCGFPVCAAGAGAPSRLEYGAGLDQRAAQKPASGVSAVQGEHRVDRAARP